MSPPLSLIEISGASLRHNFAVFKRLLGFPADVIAVVKANAYGHGLAEVVVVLKDLGCSFQLDDIEELRELRKITDARTLLFGYVQRSDLEEALSLRAELAVLDEEQLTSLCDLCERTGQTASIHLAIDSLFGREGTIFSDTESLLRLVYKVEKQNRVRVVGFYSHLSSSDISEEITAQQLEAFNSVRKLFSPAFPDAVPSIEASPGALLLAKQKRSPSLARVGLGLYGMWPSEYLRKLHPDVMLKPCLTWKTRVAQVKELPANYPVGYGQTFRTKERTRIALLPIGYSDGFDRALSGIGEVLIRGNRCKILGRVSMNMTVVDCSHLPSVAPEDPAVLLGESGSDRITADEIAVVTGTINYEVTSRISALLPRRLVE